MTVWLQVVRCDKRRVGDVRHPLKCLSSGLDPCFLSGPIVMATPGPTHHEVCMHSSIVLCSYELLNVVETALARALVLAAEAKRWGVVMQIAGELGRRGSGHHNTPNRG